ncbi:MAG: hypothetical protein GF308_06960 [Candidatus Heimdallarchaeota archaeon]|nr:hypothetical protein [Candidatus Heimdallarchaeota archaeon]
MQVKPFVATRVGELPLNRNRPIKPGEKLRLIIAPSNQEALNRAATHLEINNPLERQIVRAALPSYDPTKLIVFDMMIDEKWLKGAYKVSILDIKGSVIGSGYFFVDNTTLKIPSRIVNPHWRINYSLKIKNPTDKPIGNFSAYIALPITVPPYQIVKNLTIFPRQLKTSTDIEGNHWTRFEIARIAPLEAHQLSYTALVETRPFLISQNYQKIGQNKYTRQFLSKYLLAEPHIESDDPTIVKLAREIQASKPLQFVKEAIKIINQKITYEIQEGEFGAAYAIKTGKGDCTEFAALFVALCRARGIPARTVAGFGYNGKWERHGSAEVLLGGRWMPIDPTGQKEKIFIGFLPTNILLTRGNWMGGTLAKEISYKYQVMERTQSLAVDIDWKISYGNEHQRKESTNQLETSVRILEPKKLSEKELTVQIIDFSKRKAESHVKPQQQNKEKNQEKEKIKLIAPSEGIIKVPQKKGHNQSPREKFDLKVSVPDVIRAQSIIHPSIELRNPSEHIMRGCFEIRLLQDGIIKLLSCQGIIVPPEKRKQFSPKIKLDLPGINELTFIFTNRIGRRLVRVDKKISVY